MNKGRISRIRKHGEALMFCKMPQRLPRDAQLGFPFTNSTSLLSNLHATFTQLPLLYTDNKGIVCIVYVVFVVSIQSTNQLQLSTKFSDRLRINDCSSHLKRKIFSEQYPSMYTHGCIEQKTKTKRRINFCAQSPPKNKQTNKQTSAQCRRVS